MAIRMTIDSHRIRFILLRLVALLSFIITFHVNHHADRIAVGTNRDERVQTSGRLSCKIRLRRKHTTTHGEVSRRWLPELKTVYQSVLGSPFQAQISGASSPHTKDCINAC